MTVHRHRRRPVRKVDPSTPTEDLPGPRPAADFPAPSVNAGRPGTAERPAAGPAAPDVLAALRGNGQPPSVAATAAPPAAIEALVRHTAAPAQAGPAIRRCVKCLDTSCLNGEVCGFDPTFGGFFGQGDVATVVPYKQARNHPSGGTMEFEHPIAGAALKKSGVPHSYRDEFTIQTPKTTHRGAVSGAGGGITSTGSSTTARLWAQTMGDTMADDPAEAVRVAAVEQYNAHVMARTLDERALNGIVLWVHSQESVGRIDAGQRDDIVNALASRWANDTFGH